MAKFVLPVGDPTQAPTQLTELVIDNVKYNINDKGEAVDTEGKVIKTKDELEKLKTPIPPVLTEEEKKKAADLAARIVEVDKLIIEGVEIDLDGEKFTVTKEGTIVKDGKVFKTKDELRQLYLTQEENEEVNYITEVQKSTNLSFTNEQNQPITYENTVPGITQYVKDVHSNGVKLGQTQYEQTLFNQFPILKDVLNHLTITKGSLEGFNASEDFSKVTITDDENQHIDIYTKAQLQRGLSQGEVTTMLGYLKADKKLKEAATTSLTYLQTAQADMVAKRASDAKVVKEAEEAEVTKYWNEVHTALNSKQFVINDKKFNIPEVIKVKDDTGKIVVKSINDFVEYIEKPLNFNLNGQIYTMTQHDYDELVETNKRTSHNDLFDAFRRFVNYDDTQLIAANISSQNVKQILKIKSKSDGGGSGTAQKGAKLNLPIK